ncbi:alpha/beta hydrolase [Coralliovum pocilloporae]|uniref:alpha/beta hydrolase n=1 Tax=Coralliovum pocilloporae TaxID=3066369 RepID=UPI003307AEDE
MRLFLILLLIVCVLYGGALAALYFKQRQLLYFPDPQRVSPADIGLAQFSVEELQTPDGETLIAWYAEAQNGLPTLLRFHGNASTVDYEAKILSHYLDHGYGLMILSYRGFAGSTGSPSEDGLILDGLTAYDALAAKGVPPEQVIVSGHSLGAGIVVQIAARRPVRAAILVSPFTAASDVAQERYPWVPVSLLMKDQYRSREQIGKITAPILIIHGTQDQTIPVAHGERLFALANEPKELAILEGAGHANLMDYGSEERALAFLSDLVAAKAAE